MLETGQIVTKTNAEVRCMINGDLAIEKYDPRARLDGERAEPVTIQQGPQKGDILLVLIDQCRAACEVLDVGTRKGRPLYLVKYDDGMLVQDHLVVPWTYLSTAPTKSSTDLNPSVAATEPVSASPPEAPLQSAKSLGKHRMIDVIADAAETVEVLPLTPAASVAAAPPAAPAATAPAATASAAAPFAAARVRVEAAERAVETRQENKYGKLLDSIVL